MARLERDAMEHFVWKWKRQVLMRVEDALLSVASPITQILTKMICGERMQLVMRLRSLGSCFAEFSRPQSKTWK